MNTESEWYRAKRKKHKIMIAIIIAAVVLSAAVLLFAFREEIFPEKELSPWEPFEVTPEKLAEYAPIDESAAAAIEAAAPIKDGETWAFYFYIVGSNLESCGLDETTDITTCLIGDEAESISEASRQSAKETVRNFTQEVTDKGCTLPDVLYTPTVHYQDTGYYEEDTDYARGYATSDLNSMMVENLPDNATIVVQTGGSNRWENVQINPNKSQRFTVDSNGLTQVYEGPVVNMGSSGTLADFISFCLENYPADHKALIFWDHGGGAVGYGHDEQFGNSYLTLKDISAALSDTAEFNENSPVFDIIGFDACLMSCVETAHSLYGYGKYMLASEELEPNEGWDYETVFTALGDNPYMSVEKLCRTVADSFVESSIAVNADSGRIDALQFSVTDINGGEAAYKAYTLFCESALKLAAEDTSNLATLCRAAASAVAFGQESYENINMIDMGGFMQESGSLLPDESSAVLRALDRAVVYNRGSSYLKESTGLSVYFPARIKDVSGLLDMLNVNDTAYDSSAVKALNYYKVAGCLNDALIQQAGELGISDIPVLDYSIMDSIPSNDVECANGNLKMKLTEQQVNLTQDVSMSIVWHDTETDELVYYGNDSYARLKEDNSVETTYGGKWVFFGGYPLPLEIVSKTGEDITFRSKVEYNGISAWLMTSYSAEEDEMTFLGIREASLEPGMAGRSMLTPKEGDIISIIYECGNLFSSESYTAYEEVIYSPGATVIEEQTLPDGSYYQYIEVQDIRSDIYRSKVASFDIEDGQICNHGIDETVINYEKNN